jgi:hypothetical protein
MYKVVGCDTSKFDCIHREVCGKVVGYIHENEFKCDHYKIEKSDSTVLVDLGEKYLGDKNE